MRSPGLLVLVSVLLQMDNKIPTFPTAWGWHNQLVGICENDIKITIFISTETHDKQPLKKLLLRGRGHCQNSPARLHRNTVQKALILTPFSALREGEVPGECGWGAEETDPWTH